MKEVAIGDIVWVIFLDHAQCSDDSLRFEVFGRLNKITKTSYIVTSWGYVDEIDRLKDHNVRHNEETFAIVKKAVESIKSLR